MELTLFDHSDSGTGIALIHSATIADLDAVASVEAECLSSIEAATAEPQYMRNTYGIDA